MLCGGPAGTRAVAGQRQRLWDRHWDFGGRCHTSSLREGGQGSAKFLRRSGNNNTLTWGSLSLMYLFQGCHNFTTRNHTLIPILVDLPSATWFAGKSPISNWTSIFIRTSTINDEHVASSCLTTRGSSECLNRITSTREPSSIIA